MTWLCICFILYSRDTAIFIIQVHGYACIVKVITTKQVMFFVVFVGLLCVTRKLMGGEGGGGGGMVMQW